MQYATSITKKSALNSVLLFALIWPAITSATVIRMETSMGNIDIELFDTLAPMTVSNFMNYVVDGDYVNSFISRSVPGFIIQGGGYTFDGSAAYAIPKDAPVVNEFGISNTRGTLSMAKMSTDPNSATSEWFINLTDNSANLDFQNGGFTVFGQVLGNGMDIVDAIAALSIINAGGVFSELPVINYASGAIQTENLVMVNNISSIPLPSAVWLFGSGLVGLMSLARKKIMM